MELNEVDSASPRDFAAVALLTCDLASSDCQRLARALFRTTHVVIER